MKRIIIILVLTCLCLASYSQNSDTTAVLKQDSAISFYDNYHKLYKAEINAFAFSVAGGLFVGLGAAKPIKGRRNESLNNIFYYAGGICCLVSLVNYFKIFDETRLIRNKHKKITFTPNGVIVNF